MVNTENTMADPRVANEAWVDVMRVAEAKGIPPITRHAQNARERDLAQRQTQALSRRSFGMPSGYERITWRKSA